jgi:hypothetical protein
MVCTPRVAAAANSSSSASPIPLGPTHAYSVAVAARASCTIHPEAVTNDPRSATMIAQDDGKVRFDFGSPAIASAWGTRRSLRHDTDDGPLRAATRSAGTRPRVLACRPAHLLGEDQARRRVEVVHGLHEEHENVGLAGCLLHACLRLWRPGPQHRSPREVHGRLDPLAPFGRQQRHDAHERAAQDRDVCASTNGRDRA